VAAWRRRIREQVAAPQRHASLSRQSLCKLAGNDLLDRARRTLHFDTMIAFEQIKDFLARYSKNLSDLVDADG
jgi:hypothetical protein